MTTSSPLQIYARLGEIRDLRVAHRRILTDGDSRAIGKLAGESLDDGKRRIAGAVQREDDLVGSVVILVAARAQVLVQVRFLRPRWV